MCNILNLAVASSPDFSVFCCRASLAGEGRTAPGAFPSALSIGERQDIEVADLEDLGMAGSPALVTTATRGPDSESLGTRLRHLRSTRNLTIAQLAEQAGVSSGLISQIERGNSNPSIKTLQRLRAALGVNLWEFLDSRAAAEAGDGAAPVASPYVRRREDRPRIIVGASRLVKELLSPRSDRNLRFMIISLPPGGESEDVIIGQGEKGGLVTRGRVRLTVGSDESDLGEGDSFQFPSSIPHKLSNPSDAPAQVIWIMSVVDSHI
jgi:transcriptional regulator with XRE-family HTH domain